MYVCARLLSFIRRSFPSCLRWISRASFERITGESARHPLARRAAPIERRRFRRVYLLALSRGPRRSVESEVTSRWTNWLFVSSSISLRGWLQGQTIYKIFHLRAENGPKMALNPRFIFTCVNEGPRVKLPRFAAVHSPEIFKYTQPTA